jgi:hypothetical protein
MMKMKLSFFLKSMDGLVQGARQFFLIFVRMLKDIGFTQSVAESG